MKASILKALAGLAGCFFLISSTTLKNPEPAAPKPFTAYWIVKSGDELIQVSKSSIPESALSKDNNGQLANVDNDLVQSKLQYRNQQTHNGKNVDASFIVLTDGDESGSAGSVIQKISGGKSVNIYSIQECAALFAYASCWGGINIGTCNYFILARCYFAGSIPTAAIWHQLTSTMYYIQHL